MTVKPTDPTAEKYLTGFFKIGFVSINIKTYPRYNQVFEAYLSQGYSRNKAYNFAADECGTCRNTIIKAVSLMNREFDV